MLSYYDINADSTKDKLKSVKLRDFLQWTTPHCLSRSTLCYGFTSQEPKQTYIIAWATKADSHAFLRENVENKCPTSSQMWLWYLQSWMQSRSLFNQCLQKLSKLQIFLKSNHFYTADYFLMISNITQNSLLDRNPQMKTKMNWKCERCPVLGTKTISLC